MNSKEIAELAAQIVVAVIGSGKYDCTDSEKGGNSRAKGSSPAGYV